MACNKDAATHRREGHVQTAHAGVLEIRVELRFLLLSIRLIFTADGLRINNFQGIRIDGFGRQSESLLSRERREQTERARGTDAKQPHLRQPPQIF